MIHGLFGSQGDGEPVHTNIAKKFNSNIYLFRNAHHGVDLGDSTMLHANANDFINAAEKALAITKKLGDEVIVMGTSLGGLLTLYLASQHPEIKAIILYAPGVAAYDKRAKLILGPWGYEIAKLVMGGEYRVLDSTNTVRIKTHSEKAHINAMVAALNLMKYAMTTENFNKIKCPTFLGYWYKNEEEQDKMASVEAMLKMYDELGVPANLKREIAFPNAGDHVIASMYFTDNYRDVEIETEKFLHEVVLKK